MNGSWTKNGAYQKKHPSHSIRWVQVAILFNANLFLQLSYVNFQVYITIQ